VQLSLQDEAFRGSVRQWLTDNLSGEVAGLRGAGGPGREHEAHAERLSWNRHLAAAGWTCLSWPAECGGRGATLAQQVIFYEEYARSRAPARVGYVGEELLGPTLIAFGTPEQRQRFLPPIAAVDELWCQGYSEPGAGSDLASVATRAVLITVRPIRQLTGTSEFSEVFFDGARTDRCNVVGEVGGGWRVAQATLAVERGAATLGQQVGFRRELDRLLEEARHTGADRDPVLRDRLARAWIGLEVGRAHALRTMASQTATRNVAAGKCSRRECAWRECAWREGPGQPVRRGSVGNEAAVVTLASGARRAGHGRTRRLGAAGQGGAV
jgi:alkylation response protein AidB-like acyl-CoA dehydrogenase